MQDLFGDDEDVKVERADSAPLATRMRPRSLDELVGQEHILAPGKLLRRAIEADRLPSVIFSGPPGTGKTTLARIIAEMTHAKFIRISGVESNVGEMRRVIAAAANRLRTSGRNTILFVDEIHHFNKAQQDILLPDVEAGTLRLIGATTYNPFFYVNSALVSRSQVFRLEPLTVEQLEVLIDRALADKERGLGNYNVKVEKNARRHLAKLSDGDARKCLNALEIGVLTTPSKGNNSAIHFTLQIAEESIQQKAVVYDRAGDAHYDTISAFIKSMRASDEKGAMYWLAKMLHAGEDFRFIARRIVIFASEDIGLADPDALRLAIATQQAVEFVGMPEARIPLAHATAYMCRAAKSREAYDELNAAIEKVEMEQTKQRPRASQEQTFPGESRRVGARAPGAPTELTKENKDNERLATRLQPSFSSLPSVEIFRHAAIRGGDWSRWTGVAFSATDSFFAHNFCAAICSRGAHCGRERLAVIENFCSGYRLHGVRAHRSDAF